MSKPYDHDAATVPNGHVWMSCMAAQRYYILTVPTQPPKSPTEKLAEELAKVPGHEEKDEYYEEDE